MNQFTGYFIWESNNTPANVGKMLQQSLYKNEYKVKIGQSSFYFGWEGWKQNGIRIEHFEAATIILIGSGRRQPGSQSENDILQDLSTSILENRPVSRCLSDLDGEFILITLNKKEEATYLAVDPIGNCQLYYSLFSGGILFASHPQIIADWTGKRELDKEGVNLFLSLKGIPAPWSILQDVKKVKPGYVRTASRLGNTEEKYWFLEERVSKNYQSDLKTAQEDLQQKLTSVIKNYVSGISSPVGIFLSGGLDSTLIMSLAHQSKIDIKAFSAGYQPMTRGDETAYAKLASLELGVPIQIEASTGKDILYLIENDLPALPEPIADPTWFPQMYLTRKAATQVKVILDGTGSDGLFGGSPKYIADRISNVYLRIPAFLRHGLITPISNLFPASRKWQITDMIRKWQFFIAGCEVPEQEREIYWTMFMHHPLVEKLLTPAWGLEQDLGKQLLETARSEFGKKDISGASYLTLKYIMPWYELYKLNSLSMMCNTSIRKPFLSTSLVEFGLILPDEFKVSKNRGKIVLRNMSKNLVPEAIYQRGKANFSPPITSWLQNDLKEIFWETFLQNGCIFQKETIQHMARQNQQGWRDWRSELWASFVLQYWCNRNKVSF